MTFSVRVSRRWQAFGFLSVAAAMLIFGMTVLDARLSPHQFVFYWMLCLIFTTLAAWTALIDVREIKERSRQAQRELIEETLSQLERDRDDRRQVE